MVIGFPIAVILAWAFELTPEGIKRVDSPTGTSTSGPSRAWLYVTAVAGLFSLGLFFVVRYTAPHGGGPPVNNAIEKSIAVLPFENLTQIYAWTGGERPRH